MFSAIRKVDESGLEKVVFFYFLSKSLKNITIKNPISIMLIIGMITNTIHTSEEVPFVKSKIVI
jgi:hypothetical protein